MSKPSDTNYPIAYEYTIFYQYVIQLVDDSDENDLILSILTIGVYCGEVHLFHSNRG